MMMRAHAAYRIILIARLRIPRSTMPEPFSFASYPDRFTRLSRVWARRQCLATFIKTTGSQHCVLASTNSVPCTIPPRTRFRCRRRPSGQKWSANIPGMRPNWATATRIEANRPLSARTRVCSCLCWHIMEPNISRPYAVTICGRTQYQTTSSVVDRTCTVHANEYDEVGCTRQSPTNRGYWNSVAAAADSLLARPDDTLNNRH